MKKYFVLVLLSFLVHIALAQTPVTTFILTGHTWQKEGIAKLFLYTEKREFIPYDSTEMKDGNFSFQRTLDEPKIFQLQAGKRSRILFIGNETVAVTEKDSITGEMIVSGSKLTDDYDLYFNKWIVPLIEQSQGIDKALEKTEASQKKKRDSLTAVQSSLFSHLPDSAVTFIRKHPHSFVSLRLLNDYMNTYNIILLHSLYSLLDKSLKQYPSAVLIKQRIETGLHQSAPCPDFSVRDSAGEMITLQTFRGSYLLIDFWAGWCIPCAEDLPSVKKAAEQFQHDNLNVLTASLDRDTTIWKLALKKYRLNNVCHNVFLPGQFHNPMAIQFSLSYLPQNVLVNPQGIIIARNIEGKDLIQRLQSLMHPVTAGGDDVAVNNVPEENNKPR